VTRTIVENCQRKYFICFLFGEFPWNEMMNIRKESSYIAHMKWRRVKNIKQMKVNSYKNKYISLNMFLVYLLDCDDKQWNKKINNIFSWFKYLKNNFTHIWKKSKNEQLLLNNRLILFVFIFWVDGCISHRIYWVQWYLLSYNSL
jgi:hypothetical protein